MARVLLIHAALEAQLRYGSLAWAGARLPGLGILYIAGALCKAGHRVLLADTAQPGATPKNLADAARAFEPDMVGISATSASLALAGRLAGLLKGAVPGAAFVIGGPHVSALPEQTLTDLPVFNFAVAGEGEQAAVELADLLDSREKAFAPPAGVWARQGDELVRGPVRQPVKNLDDLAHPAWDLLEGFPAAFHPAVFRLQKTPAAQLVTSRGCPHSCIFCAKPLGKSLRLASPECVLEQALILHKNFSVCEIAFEDDHFLADKDRAAAICELLAKNLPGLSFSISSRADAIDDPALLALLRRAGCWQINLGIESADQKIL
ncbi:MAG: radical SAM protein, partial [Desulfatibacillaceae bacterium]|nr:radical SAM protein [Desulfatibacillaceae bacterium]